MCPPQEIAELQTHQQMCSHEKVGLFHTSGFTGNKPPAEQYNWVFHTHLKKQEFITHTWTTKLYNRGNHLTKYASQFSVCLCLTTPPSLFFFSLSPLIFSSCTGMLYLNLNCNKFKGVWIRLLAQGYCVTRASCTYSFE